MARNVRPGDVVDVEIEGSVTRLTVERVTENALHATEADGEPVRLGIGIAFTIVKDGPPLPPETADVQAPTEAPTDAPRASTEYALVYRLGATVIGADGATQRDATATARNAFWRRVDRLIADRPDCDAGAVYDPLGNLVCVVARADAIARTWGARQRFAIVRDGRTSENSLRNRFPRQWYGFAA